jgi:YegS/Rv2252/BmrU family lipid kinase
MEAEVETSRVLVEAEVETSRVLLIVNVKSGNLSPEEVRHALETDSWGSIPRTQIHKPQEGEDIVAIVREAVAEGFDTVVAAGGDGTASAVANGLIDVPARLGIIPLGTANVLARELNIPVALDAACAVLSGPNRTVAIDAMRVREKHSFTQISIGVDAAMIRDTKVKHKRWLGNLEYIWTAVTRLLGFQPCRFSISADGKRSRPRALQVVLANCGALGTTKLRWGPDVYVDDGQIDVCILRARTLLDYLSVGLGVLQGRYREDRNVEPLSAGRAVAVHADKPLPI